MSSKESQSQNMRRLPRGITNVVLELRSQVESLQKLAKKHAPKLNFTLDGRLVGDIGELLAAMELGIKIQNRQKTGFDGTDKELRHVEIKTTFKDAFAFRKIAERVICIKLHGATHWEIIYDGPGAALLHLFPKDSFVETQKVTHKVLVSLKSQRQLSISKVQSLTLPASH